MRRFLGPGNVALAVLGVLAAVLLVLAIQKQNALPTASGLGVATPPPGPASVAFVGDGYTSGSPAGGEGPANYTELLAAREGWRVTNPSEYGAGYVAGLSTLGDQVPKAADARPRLVVVSGGRADLGEEPAAVRDAAGRLYQDLRARVPQAGGELGLGIDDHGPELDHPELAATVADPGLPEEDGTAVELDGQGDGDHDR